MAKNLTELDDLLGITEPVDDETEDTGEGDEQSSGQNEEESAGSGDDESGEGDVGGDSKEEEEPAEGQEDEGDEDEDDEEGGEEAEGTVVADPNISKRERGFLREMAKLRRENKALKSRLTPTPPQPGITTAPPVAPKPPKVAITLDEDGKSVLIDPQALEAIVHQRTQQAVSQALQPDPKAVRDFRIRQATDKFISVDPDTRKEVVMRAHQADEYVSTLLQNAMAQGAQFTDMDDAIEYLQANGVDKQIQEFFPEIGTAVAFDEFVEGMASGKASLRRSILERMTPKKVKGITPVPEKRGVERLKKTPKAMASTPGARVKRSPDQVEFDALDAKFASNPLEFSDKELKRLKYLGKRLGIEGLEEL